MELIIWALGESWVGHIVDLLGLGIAVFGVLFGLRAAILFRSDAHYPAISNGLKWTAASLFTAVMIWFVWKKIDSSPPYVFTVLCKGIVVEKAAIASGKRVLPDIDDIPVTRAWRDGCANYLSQP